MRVRTAGLLWINVGLITLACLLSALDLARAFGAPPLVIPPLGAWGTCASSAAALVATGACLVALAASPTRRRFAATGATLRIALYLAAAAAAVFLAFLQPYEERKALAFLPVPAAALALVILWAPSLRRDLPRRLIQVLDVVLLNTVLAAVAGEIALRTAAHVTPHAILARASSASEERVAQGRLPAGATRFGFPLESHGYFDAEYDPHSGKQLIACIGDSFSLGASPHYYHYTTVAERELPGVEIFNIGVPGIGPPEYLYLLQRDALPLKPRMVVVALFVGNDIAENDRYVGTDGALASVLDRENTLIYLVPKRLRQLAAERRAGIDAGAESRREAGGAAPPTLAELAERYPEILDPTREKAIFSEDAFLRMERDRARLVFRSGELGLYQSLFPVLERIRDVGGSTPIVFLLIPTELQVDDALWERIAAAFPAQALDRDQPQRVLRDWFDAKGFLYVDPLPAFRAVPPLADGSRHLFSLRNTHVNTRGNEVLGRALAEFLRPYLGATDESARPATESDRRGGGAPSP